MKPRTYVIGDIHGGFLALKQVLERCGFRYKIDTLITIGDIVDGRDGVYDCIEELLKIPNRIDIRGNHDQWMLEFIETGIHPERWGQGAIATCNSYADALGMNLLVQEHETKYFNRISYTYTTNLIPEDITESHQNFYKRQHRYYRDDNNNIFVHGGINRFIPVGEQIEYHMMWDRKMWTSALDAKRSGTKMKWTQDYNKIFIGHTSTQAWGTTEPMYADKIWNLDTGAGGNGKLTIMNVDTEEYWQSDLMNDIYPNEKRYR